MVRRCDPVVPDPSSGQHAGSLATVTRRIRILLWVNAGWMAFIWITRIRNAVDDHTSSTANHAVAYVLSAICLAGALVLAVIAWRKLTTRPAVLAIAGIAVAHIGI